MKASRCTFACAARLTCALAAAALLSQCSMPPEQAWRYIQTNGLLSYMQAPRQSPPFGTGNSLYQRHSGYPLRRSNLSGNWGSGMASRTHYGAAGVQNSYFNSYSSGSGSSRYVPRSRSVRPEHEHHARVKIPVEEPSQTPQTAGTPPPEAPAPKTNASQISPSPAPASTAESVPYGTAVPGRANMVNSPFAGKTQLVDVSGMRAGQTVKCPYTGRLFRVPPTQQAASHVEARLGAKTETAPPSGEKAGDKKP